MDYKVPQVPGTEYVLSQLHQPQTETWPVGDRWLDVRFSPSISTVKQFLKEIFMMTGK